MTACDSCLRRTALIASLAPHIERARRSHRHISELLALGDDGLLAALAGTRRADLERAHESFDGDGARDRIDRARLHALCRHDADYPARLAQSADAPAVLHVAGDPARLVALGPPDAPAVAVVGSRRAGRDGLEIAHGLGRGLAAAGVSVVSGMALGIDSAAHGGALEVGGPTLTVLASGADVPYPPSKRGLYRAIVETQAAVSEMPPGFRPLRWCFPALSRDMGCPHAEMSGCADVCSRASGYGSYASVRGAGPTKDRADPGHRTRASGTILEFVAPCDSGSNVSPRPVGVSPTLLVQPRQDADFGMLDDRPFHLAIDPVVLAVRVPGSEVGVLAQHVAKLLAVDFQAPC
jgi:hypothetical protein